MAKSISKKIIATHPQSKREMKIDAAIYKPFEAAIIQSLKGSKARLPDRQAKTFTELTDAVAKIIKKKIPDFKKSIPWYTISILRDLESRGVAETFFEKGIKLNRLKK